MAVGDFMHIRRGISLKLSNLKAQQSKGITCTKSIAVLDTSSKVCTKKIAACIVPTVHGMPMMQFLDVCLPSK